MFGEKILVLQNWKECTFDFQIEIKFNNDMPQSKYSINHQDRYYGITYHKSLNAAKSFIRTEYTVKGQTPKLKWVIPQETK